MKRTWVDYTDEFVPGPMTVWVHRPVGTTAWWHADRYEPPLPKPVGGSGFACFHVEFDGVQFDFASLEELRHCIDVLGRRLLPTTRALSEGTSIGPNSHWLSRLPSAAKPWKYRAKAVPYLRLALDEFEGERRSP